jgi:hypothetical protein
MKMVGRNVSYIIVVMVFLFFSGCSYESPVVALTHIEWYTTTETIDDFTFGFVRLSISGTTSGDKVTIMTYGDGVILEKEIDLDQNNQFNEEVTIVFTHMVDDEPRIYSTTLTAYRGNRFNKIDFVSDELTY